MRGLRGGILALAGGLAALALAVGQGGAAAGPAGGASDTPDLLFLTPVPTTGFHWSSPVFLTAPPGDPTRRFVVQQGGQIMLLTQNNPAPTTFMTVPNVNAGGERGLLSMAFAPDYATSRRFYVYYTRTGDGAIQVDEFLRDAVNPDLGDPSTRRAVITVLHPGQSNHNGGQLQFGPDGMLYMATGDGGGAGDPFRAAMNLQDLRGNLTRIAHCQNGADPCTGPANSPFAGQPPSRPEIWAYGLRNPWRFSFDRVTAALNIGDVGQGAWE